MIDINNLLMILLLIIVFLYVKRHKKESFDGVNKVLSKYKESTKEKISQFGKNLNDSTDSLISELNIEMEEWKKHNKPEKILPRQEHSRYAVISEENIEDHTRNAQFISDETPAMSKKKISKLYSKYIESDEESVDEESLDEEVVLDSTKPVRQLNKEDNFKKFLAKSKFSQEQESETSIIPYAEEETNMVVAGDQEDETFGKFTKFTKSSKSLKPVSKVIKKNQVFIPDEESLAYDETQQVEEEINSKSYFPEYESEEQNIRDEIIRDEIARDSDKLKFIQNEMVDEEIFNKHFDSNKIEEKPSKNQKWIKKKDNENEEVSRNVFVDEESESPIYHEKEYSEESKLLKKKNLKKINQMKDTKLLKKKIKDMTEKKILGLIEDTTPKDILKKTKKELVKTGNIKFNYKKKTQTDAIEEKAINEVIKEDKVIHDKKKHKDEGLSLVDKSSLAEMKDRHLNLVKSGVFIEPEYTNLEGYETRIQGSEVDNSLKIDCKEPKSIRQVYNGMIKDFKNDPVKNFEIEKNGKTTKFGSNDYGIYDEKSYQEKNVFPNIYNSSFDPYSKLD